MEAPVVQPARFGWTYLPVEYSNDLPNTARSSNFFDDYQARLARADVFFLHFAFFLDVTRKEKIGNFQEESKKPKKPFSERRRVLPARKVH